MSVISMILAGMTIEHGGMGHLDHAVDHIDHIDHVDHLDHAVDHIDHIDHVDHLDHAVDHIDHIDHVDHLDHAVDHVDHIDHVDHLDHAVDHVDHIDHVDHLDHAIDHVDHLDHIDHIDHADHVDQSGPTEYLAKDHLYKFNHFKNSGASNTLADITPAPFMLLFSEFLLVFGILGIIFYFLTAGWFQWIIFLVTPLISLLLTKLVSKLWKKIAINRHYDIISNSDLIGKVGEVVLEVDEKGGVIKIRTDTPLEFEKLHSKPIDPKKRFIKGQYVYICGKKDDYFLVDDKIRPQEVKLKWCPNCGASIEEDGSFCEYCGAKLS
ncbi:MAG: zinc-ribbon domain-containing protein [Candidatus Helarchaeota archaeon]